MRLIQRPSSQGAGRSLLPTTVLMSIGLCAALLSNVAHAALFADDEARKAILDLRERVEGQRRSMERLNADFTRLSEDQGASNRRALLDLTAQLDTVKQELARQQGQIEQLARDVAVVQRQQKDVLLALDERLRQLEPAKVTLDGVEFRVKPEEKAEYDRAFESVRSGAFEQALTGFAQLIQRYPGTGYQPSALYWQGNAQFALGRYKEAVESYRRLIVGYPDHVRAPEARLATANCQLELKDAKSARKTLEDLIRLHPQSEAANAARDRLARMKP